MIGGIGKLIERLSARSEIAADNRSELLAQRLDARIGEILPDATIRTEKSHVIVEARNLHARRSRDSLLHWPGSILK